MRLFATRKKTHRDRCQRKFFLEALERRTLLAGNVSVGFDPTGALLITGDKKDNNVAITEDAGGGLMLTSANSRINGQASPLDLSGLLDSNPSFSGDVVVDLGSGNDVLSITGNAQAGNLSENLTIN